MWPLLDAAPGSKPGVPVTAPIDPKFTPNFNWADADAWTAAGKPSYREYGCSRKERKNLNLPVSQKWTVNADSLQAMGARLQSRHQTHDGVFVTNPKFDNSEESGCNPVQCYEGGITISICYEEFPAPELDVNLQPPTSIYSISKRTAGLLSRNFRSTCNSMTISSVP